MYINKTTEELRKVIGEKYNFEFLNSNGGVYMINFHDEKCYIGSCKLTKKAKRDGFLSRWYNHLRELILKNHPNRKLQNAFNKYGKEKIKFDILSICKNEESVSLEQFYIDKYNSVERGYNICPKAGSSFGKRVTEEQRKKMSITRKNNFASGKYIPYNRGIKKGPLSEDTKKKISERNKGKKGVVHTKETKQEIKEKLKELYKDGSPLKKNLIQHHSTMGKFLGNHPNAKKVFQYSMSGEFIKEWSCAREVTKNIGIGYKDISSCCKKNKLSAGGFLWTFTKSERIPPYSPMKHNQFSRLYTY